MAAARDRGGLGEAQEGQRERAARKAVFLYPKLEIGSSDGSCSKYGVFMSGFAFLRRYGLGV